MAGEDSAGGAGGELASLGPGSRLGGYQLEEQVGAGGMAVVFRAADERLGRRVALKVLAPTYAADPEFRRRFLRESRAAAAVDDPNIIPVYEAGEADGVLFIAMRFVPGGDVRLLLAQGGPLTPARAVTIISSMASALDAAHARGLIHRDVKPANMLLDVRPDHPDHVYLSDFGISKAALSSGRLTGAGQFLGTPDYTAPEQIQGDVVDGRTDQYALACAAFELLTGDVPFRRDLPMAVLYAHVQQPPPSLVSRRPGLPAAADPVLARAMAKRPQDRYPTCGLFADALRVALGVDAHQKADDGQSVPDHWPAGHPKTEISASSAIEREVAPTTIDLVPKDAAKRQAEVINAKSRPATGRVGTASGEGDRPVRRRRWLILGAATACAVVAVVVVAMEPVANGGHRSAGPSAQTGLVAAKKPAATLVDLGGSPVTAMAFSPDSRTIATGGNTAKTSLWDVATGELASTLTGPNNSFGVEKVAFSPDGRTLAVGDEDASTYLGDVGTGRVTATLPAAPKTIGGVNAVAFSPNGHTLAVSNAVSTYLWDVASRRTTAKLVDPGASGGAIDSEAFSPDGHTLAVVDSGNGTYIWNVATRHVVATLDDPNSLGIDGAAFSPNGRSLAVGDDNGSVYLWNSSTWRRLATFTDPSSGGARTVAFSADGSTLAVGSDRDTYLWDVTTRRLTATLVNPDHSPVSEVGFSPNDRILAEGNDDGHTYLWKVSRRW